MIKVTQIQRTCGACPSQWEGKTDDDREVYVRYRWGHLAVQIAAEPGHSVDHMMGPDLISEQVGDKLDGLMSYDQLRDLTKGQIEWPETEGMARR